MHHCYRLCVGFFSARVDNVELALVRGKGESVRPHEVVSDNAHRATAGVDPVDVAGSYFAVRLVALVVSVDAVARVGEPDGAVRVLDNIVRAIEPPAVRETISEHDDRAVVLGAGDPAIALLTADEATLTVD